AMWDRDRHGHPVEPGTLVCHSDAGSQGEINRSSQHLVITEVSDGAATAASGSGFASSDAITGAADPGQVNIRLAGARWRCGLGPAV
ncbi:MAG: hypothetical protein Q8P61_01010, partial [Candidatus Nanopelagicales bacterium]|nr:hypothetical protein [Candidatus Nanopelagicales bacterium]